MTLIWKRIDKYFSPHEWWGQPEKISGLLLMVLYQIRCSSGWPMVIHCGTQGQHRQNSYHYKGLAADFHFKTPNGSIELLGQVVHLLDFFADMQLSDSVGFGAYPHWHNPGFHLDVRGKKARWGKIDGKYVSFQIVLDYLRENG